MAKTFVSLRWSSRKNHLEQNYLYNSAEAQSSLPIDRGLTIALNRFTFAHVAIGSQFLKSVTGK